MLITSGLSPTSGELLEDSSSLHIYGSPNQPYGAQYDEDDFQNVVPESSHTIEIEYVTEQVDTSGGNYTYIMDERGFAINDEVVCTTNEVVYATTESVCTTNEMEDNIVSEDIQSEDEQNIISTEHNSSTSAASIESNDEDVGETDLTNLTWLQNITNIMALPNLPIPPVSPKSQKVQPQNTRLKKLNQTIEKCQADFMQNLKEYQNHSEKKPPYSYSTLICVAMRNNNNKMTLSAIYGWIRENFKYYRNADPTWQNSIRHNLSLNKMFVKVARSKQEPGKGGFWKLDLGRLEDGKPTLSCSKPHKKKTKKASNAESIHKNGEQAIESNMNFDESMGDNPQVSVDDMNDHNLNSTHQTPQNEYIMQDFTFDELPMARSPLNVDVGANIIVEPAIPPPLIPDEDLASILLNPTDWGDLQLEMLDSLLDSCFK